MRVMVVLPVPGPPVSTKTFSARAVRTARRCSSDRTSPASASMAGSMSRVFSAIPEADG